MTRTVARSVTIVVLRRSRPTLPTTGPFIAGTWLGARPAAGDEHRVLSAARDIGIGVVAINEPQSDEFRDAASELGILVRSDLTLASGSAPRLGWDGGDERDFPLWIRRNKRKAGLITSFGAPSVAACNPLASDDPLVPFTNAVDPSGCIAHHTPVAPFPTRAMWAERTRHYQAMVVRFAIEAMRARRLDPVRGFFHAALLDHDAPVASPGLLGTDLAPKEAYRAFEVANRPQLAIADRLPGHLHGGEALVSDLTVVNDLDVAIRDAELRARLVWADGEHVWGKRVSVEPFAMERAGSLQFVVPAVEGELRLEVDLHLDFGRVRSLYTSEIVTHPHHH